MLIIFLLQNHVFVYIDIYIYIYIYIYNPSVCVTYGVTIVVGLALNVRRDEFCSQVRLNNLQ